MPTEYPIPPWLHGPPDPAQAYLGGIHAGAQISEAQARLSQQAQQAEMEMQARAQQMAQQHEMQQQELAVKKAYQDQQIGLQQQELGQQQQRIQIETQKAAARYAAQQKYQQLIQSGMDPARALLEVGPDLGTSMTSAAQLYKASQPVNTKPPEMRTLTAPSGKSYDVLVNNGKATMPTGTRTATNRGTVEKLHRLRAEQKELQKQLNTGSNLAVLKAMNPKGITDMQARLKELEGQIEKLESELSNPDRAEVPATGGATHRFDPATNSIVPVGSGHQGGDTGEEDSDDNEN